LWHSSTSPEVELRTGGSREALRFHDFELDLGAYQLRRQGRPVRLERRPMELLILLVEHRGRLVSRNDIAERLWGKDVFVDTETGVNIAISKVRQALRDSPEKPRFIETVVGKGYRFVAAVEAVPEGSWPGAPKLPTGVPRATADDSGSGAFAAKAPTPWGKWLLLATVSICVVVAGVAGAILVGGRSATPATLAVLPFANLTGNPDLEYLTDGLTEEATVTLAQIAPQHLSVLGRQSTLGYKNSSKPVRAIGQELGVEYLVESSVRSEGNRLRITSKLIRIRDQAQLWSQSFDRDADSVLQLQQELTTAIGEQIRVRLSPDSAATIARRQSERPEAFDLYLRGRYYAKQRTPATVAKGLEYYRQATTVDPHYGLAWAGIADALTSRPINSDVPPHEVRGPAREAAERAARAAPELAEAQTALGRVQFWLDWDWPAAESAFRRAIESDGTYPAAHLMLGHLLSQAGRHDEARAALRRARELDPLHAMSHALSAQVAFQARDYAAAREHARQATVIDSEFWIGHVQRALALEQLGSPEAALDAFTRAGRLSGGSHMTLASRGHLLARMGLDREAREVLRTLDDASGERYVPPLALALVHAGLGEREAAFAWLERALTAGDVHLVFLPVDPRWDPFRADARFLDLIARCNFFGERLSPGVADESS
jgi:TolB-like protein/DNA-binding winged helix-turn-helix (wHTH) protein/Tfp pilus assembly protein PilF